MRSRHLVMPVLTTRLRVLVSLVATLTVGLSLLAVVTGGSARADVRDGGAITPGTQVTATFTSRSDIVTYTVQVPAGRRLTLTAAASSAPVGTLVSVTSPERGWPIDQYFGNRDDYPWFTQVRADEEAPDGMVTADHTFTVKFSPSAAGTLVFTVGLVSDPEPSAVALGAPTTVRIPEPGRQVPLTVPSVPGHLIALRFSSVDVTGPRPASATDPGYSVRYVVSPWGRHYDVEKVADGVLRPRIDASAVDPSATGPWTVRLGATGANTGSYVVEIVDALPTGSATAALDTPVTFDAAAPVTEMHYTVRMAPGRRLSLAVTESSLAHPDGAAGAASAWLLVAGYTKPLGTISNRPVTLGAPESTLASSTELVIRTDGRSTGKVTFTLTPADDPAVTLAVGTPGTGTVTAPNQSLTFTFPAAAGTRYAVAVTAAALHSPTDPALYTKIYIAKPGGSPSLATSLGQSETGVTTSLTATTAGTASILFDPDGDVTGPVTVTVTAVDDTPVTTPLVEGSPVTATTPTPGRDLLFTFPGAAGGPMPTFRLTGITLASATPDPESTTATTATVGLSQNGKDFPAFAGLNASATTATLTPPETMLAYGFDGAKPWTLRISPYSDVSGSVTVTLQLPAVTLIEATSGKRYPVSFSDVTDRAKLAFTPAAGQRVLVRVEKDTASVRLSLRGETSRQTYSAGERDGEWQGFPVPPRKPEPLVLTVAPAKGSGSAVVTVLLVTDPVIAVTPGHQRTVSWKVGERAHLTFPATTGQRLALDVTQVAHAGSPDLDATLVSATGAYITSLTSISGGKPGVLELPGSTTVAETGDYQLVLRPSTGNPGTITVRLVTFADVTATATPGQPVDVRITAPGQRARIAVTVPQGGQVGYRIEDSTLAPARVHLLPRETSGYSEPVDVPKGDSTGTLTGSYPLPAGTYDVEIDPAGRVTGRMSLTLTPSPPPLSPSTSAAA